MICLATGAVLDAALGPYSSKGNSEQLGLFRQLAAAFSANNVMLTDALYCNYFLIVTLMASGVDVRFEQSGSRITDVKTTIGTEVLHCQSPQMNEKEPGSICSSTAGSDS